ncbi:putative transporter [Kluyvera cryocrescens]|uniref:Putative transporter n=1 Tax=Kluyvera cryocrescens TaxID=580 RepID=A0A485CHZ1_KLUCR|nr:putative transporter [Kluyvera cryocrescens]
MAHWSPLSASSLARCAPLFNKDPSFIGQVFTLMNIGMFIPIMLGGILMRKWGLQKPLVIAAALDGAYQRCPFRRPHADDVQLRPSPVSVPVAGFS